MNLEESLYPTPPRELRYQDVRREEGLKTGEAHTYRYRVSDRSVPFRATLVWTDFPSQPFAFAQSVNDLDLRLQTPDGNVHYANGRTSVDPNNTTEDIWLADSQVLTGTYVITVTARNVPSVVLDPNDGAQGYALVVCVGEASSEFQS